MFTSVLALVIAIGFMALVLVGVALLIELRRNRLLVDVVLQGLGETHRLGFEALTLSLERLEKRVEELERLCA